MIASEKEVFSVARDPSTPGRPGPAAIPRFSEGLSTQLTKIGERAPFVEGLLRTLVAGMDGVVASAREAALIRSHCGRGFLIVTPGIRPSWAAAGDQHRMMTPKKALQAGADYLVMGRAILDHANPEQAIKRIQEEMAQA